MRNFILVSVLMGIIGYFSWQEYKKIPTDLDFFVHEMYPQAMRFWNAGRYHDAIQNFLALAKLYPDDQSIDEAFFWTANIYQYYLNESKQAARYYRHLTTNLENSKFYEQSMLNLAGIYIKEGKEGKNKAILIYKKLQEYFQDNPKKWAQNQYKLARLYLDTNEYIQGRKALKQLIEQFPDSHLVPYAYQMIGFSYYLQGDHELAQLSYTIAAGLKKETDFLDSALGLTQLYEEHNQLQEAIREYEYIKAQITAGDKESTYYQALKLTIEQRIQALKERLRKNGG